MVVTLEHIARFEDSLRRRYSVSPNEYTHAVCSAHQPWFVALDVGLSKADGTGSAQQYAKVDQIINQSGSVRSWRDLV